MKNRYKLILTLVITLILINIVSINAIAAQPNITSANLCNGYYPENDVEIQLLGSNFYKFVDSNDTSTFSEGLDKVTYKNVHPHSATIDFSGRITLYFRTSDVGTGVSNDSLVIDAGFVKDSGGITNNQITILASNIYDMADALVLNKKYANANGFELPAHESIEFIFSEPLHMGFTTYGVQSDITAGIAPGNATPTLTWTDGYKLTVTNPSDSSIFFAKTAELRTTVTDLKPRTASNVLLIGIDTVKPTNVGEGTDNPGTIVEIDFDEELDTTYPLDPTKFILTGTTATVASATFDEYADRIILSLSGTIKYYEDNLVINIAPDAVRDLAKNGNDAISTSVTNFVPVAEEDDINNVLIVNDNNVEYSTDYGDTWTNYNPLTPPVFNGDVIVDVRSKTYPSFVSTLYFYTNPLPPAAPNVTINDASNVLVGADGTMEYSIDGGSTWIAYNPASVPTFNGNTSVKIRVKADPDTGTAAGASKTLTFTANPLAPAAPNVSVNDATNLLVGMDATMEYSTDAGASWTVYNPASVPSFNGDVNVQVRFKENTSTGAPAGAAKTLTFTTNPPAPAAPTITVDDLMNTLVGADANMEYSITTGNWIAYNPAVAPIFKGNVTVKVRIKFNNTTGAPASSETTVNFTVPQISDLTIANNSVLIGKYLFQLNDTSGYNQANVQAALASAPGQSVYFKSNNGLWYNISNGSVTSANDLFDPNKAMAASSVENLEVWKWFQAGTTVASY